MEAITRPRGRPRLEEAAEIDSLLLRTALLEFIAKGYDKASMRSIAAAANVHRSTLLGRFPSKEALFRAIMTQQISLMAASTSLEFQGKPDLRRGLIAYANRALSYSLEGDYLAINQLIYASANRIPAVGAAAKRSSAVGIAQISEFISRCAEADNIPCVAPDKTAECFTLLLRGWHAYAILNEQPVPPQEREAWVESMVDIIISGRQAW